jgi:hypothetical protein
MVIVHTFLCTLFNGNSSKGEQLNDAYSKYLSNSNCTGHITLDHDKHTLDAVLTNADGVTTSTADTG